MRRARSEGQGGGGRKLVVIGQGYVGLPVAMRAVEAGFDVVGFDLDKDKISGLVAGRSHIEDVGDAEIELALASGRYRPSESPQDLEDFHVAVISVPTPLRDGVPDISHVESAAQLLGACVTAGCLVVLESTTYPGTTDEVVCPLLESGSGLRAGSDFLVGYSPERIDPGNTVWGFRETPKVVAGIDPASLRAVSEFYAQLVDTVVEVSGTREAELTKLLENTFRHVNIALVNEMAIHARALDIDIWEVIAAASTKPFGFMPFHPGPGVGGHCLPVDPSFLSWRFERRLGAVSRFIKIADDVNNNMPSYVARRIQGGLNKRCKAVNGSVVLVLGVAYKRNSSDARETPATPLVLELLRLGADVRVHDPHVTDFEFADQVTVVEELTADVVAAADAVVLVTDHDCFDYDLIAASAEYLFDTRNRFGSMSAAERSSPAIAADKLEIL
ncbi:MAG: nucleotide sugar dehydrogenase [Acidimicrobiia bacterium]|nr:nucleotide sugar dehydrogenase [Acidimicrobiia bacterium]